MNIIIRPLHIHVSVTSSPRRFLLGPMESTALHLAARHGCAQLLGQLLVLGADAHLADASGCTPELVARRSGQVLCEQILQVVTAKAREELELLEPRIKRKAVKKQAAEELRSEEREEESQIEGAKYVQGLWSTRLGAF